MDGGHGKYDNVIRGWYRGPSTPECREYVHLHYAQLHSRIPKSRMPPSSQDHHNQELIEGATADLDEINLLRSSIWIPSYGNPGVDSRSAVEKTKEKLLFARLKLLQRKMARKVSELPIELRLSVYDLLTGGPPDLGRLEMLLARGADPNLLGIENEFPSVTWEPPLIRALVFRDKALLRLLLDHGANPGARAPVSGETALEVARRRRLSEAILDLLRQPRAR